MHQKSSHAPEPSHLKCTGKARKYFYFLSSGPQYADVVMDESQMSERKVKIKEDCDNEYHEQENSELFKVRSSLCFVSTEI